MELKINSIHEAYELKHALKHNVSRKEKLISNLESVFDSETLDKTYGRGIATLKRDNKTSIDIIKRLSEIIEEMK